MLGLCFVTLRLLILVLSNTIDIVQRAHRKHILVKLVYKIAMDTFSTKKEGKQRENHFWKKKTKAKTNR